MQMQKLKAYNDWGLLPHSVLQHVMSCLPNADVRNSAIVCHNWRRSAYTIKRVWKSIRIDFTHDCFDYHRITWDQMQKFHSLRSVQHLTLCFSSHCEGCIESLCEVINMCLKINFEGLRSFSLRPTNSGLHFDRTESAFCDTMQRLCHSLLSLACRSRQLRHLSLGLTDIFDGWQNKLLYHLQQHRCLRSLHLGSLRSDPVSSRVPFIDTRLLRCFRLTRLGLDLNQVSEDLVAALARRGDLRSLALMVHDDVTSGMPALAVRSWGALAETGCEVTVTMVHSPSGAQHYRAILPPALPLARLRLYFCQRLPPGLFEHLCASFSQRLRSFRLADSFDGESGQPNSYHFGAAGGGGVPDPLVMLAWLCTRMQELAVYGYCVSLHTLVGVAALRCGLALEVPECCLYLDEAGDAAAGGDPYGKVSHWLGYRWAPVPDGELSDGLFDPDNCSTEDAYMAGLLNEQDSPA